MMTRKYSRDECIELFCAVLSETDRALECDFGDMIAWVPKSLIHDDSEVYEVDDEGDIIVPEWYAIKEELL